jgi:hypothetical protein
VTTGRRRIAGLALSIVIAFAGGACGDDDDAGAELSADERRYCELTAEVEAAAEETFSSLGEDASDEESAAAQEALLDDVDDELDEMVEVAPAEIADDVEAFVGFFRASMRGEDADEVSDEAVVAWEEEHCPTTAE